MFKSHQQHSSTTTPKSQQPVSPIRSKKNEDLRALDSLRHWDVTMPPVRKYMVGGHLVPGFKNVFSEMSLGTILNKKRRITIELYKQVSERNYHLYRDRKIQQVFLEGFENTDGSVAAAASNNSNANSSSKKTKSKKFVLADDDVLIFRIMKPVAAGSSSKGHNGGDGGGDGDDDDGSVATDYGGLDNQYMTTFALDQYGDGFDLENTRIKWQERYRASLQAMEILKTHSRTVEIQMGISDDTIVRDFSFESIRDANLFVDIFNECRRLQRERGLRQAAAHGSMSQLQVPNLDDSDEEQGVTSRGLDLFNEDETQNASPKKKSCCACLQKPKKVYPNNLNILIELTPMPLSLPDIFSSDPYVLILDGNKEVHRTNYLPTTLNPVWTLATGSLCLVQTTLSAFFENGSYMEFFVKDYDSVGEHEILGTAMVTKKEILESEGEREELELSQFAGKNNVKSAGNKPMKLSWATLFQATLALRFKFASEEDVKFMLEFEGQETGVGLYFESSYLPLRSHPNPTIKRNKRPTLDKKATQYRVKPFPDPDRPVEETKWMTERQIEEEALKPSTQWVEAGSGGVGRYYVEIIGMDDLPNMDFSVTGRDKTDCKYPSI
ncbi:MAG: hypothetical protein SGILL_006124 [Bacillariaceae sp.]